jgi:predicted RNA-binding Zn-ribbon protein involved in translation (DUF1610 family)
MNCTRCGSEIQPGEVVQFVNPNQGDDVNVKEVPTEDMEPQHVECPT